jgi:hypothetical protein
MSCWSLDLSSLLRILVVNRYQVWKLFYATDKEVCGALICSEGAIVKRTTPRVCSSDTGCDPHKRLSLGLVEWLKW